MRYLDLFKSIIFRTYKIFKCDFNAIGIDEDKLFMSSDEEKIYALTKLVPHLPNSFMLYFYENHKIDIKSGKRYSEFAKSLLKKVEDTNYTHYSTNRIYLVPCFLELFSLGSLSFSDSRFFNGKGIEYLRQIERFSGDDIEGPLIEEFFKQAIGTFVEYRSEKWFSVDIFDYAYSWLGTIISYISPNKKEPSLEQYLKFFNSSFIDASVFSTCKKLDYSNIEEQTLL